MDQIRLQKGSMSKQSWFGLAALGFFESVCALSTEHTKLLEPRMDFPFNKIVNTDIPQAQWAVTQAAEFKSSLTLIDGRGSQVPFTVKDRIFFFNGTEADALPLITRASYLWGFAVNSSTYDLLKLVPILKPLKIDLGALISEALSAIQDHLMESSVGSLMPQQQNDLLKSLCTRYVEDFIRTKFNVLTRRQMELTDVLFKIFSQRFLSSNSSSDYNEEEESTEEADGSEE